MKTRALREKRVAPNLLKNTNREHKSGSNNPREQLLELAKQPIERREMELKLNPTKAL